MSAFKTIYSSIDLTPFSAEIEAMGFKLTQSSDHLVDVAIGTMDKLAHFNEVFNKKTTFIVGVATSMEEVASFHGVCDAWILSSSLNKLSSMFELYKGLIEQRITCRKALLTLGEVATHEEVHKANLGAIKTIMQQTTHEIETIFKSRVEEMKAIHADAQLTEKQLSGLRESMQPQEFYDLEEAWESTRSIVSRTDEVIKAMFSFVTVLQCEDRLTQMMDGISRIMGSDIEKMSQLHGISDATVIEGFKKALYDFYTIQEQRDFVMGGELRVDGCHGDKKEIASIDEIELF